jgi:SRSO17 transposase
MSTKTKMRKTTIELTEEQYFYLKEKALENQKKNKSTTVVSIIRDLIEADFKKKIRKDSAL